MFIRIARRLSESEADAAISFEEHLADVTQGKRMETLREDMDNV